MFTVAGAFFAVCVLAGAQDLVILHTNDTHSHIDPVRTGKEAGLGGVIERAAYIDSVRAAVGKGKVLLVDAGDFSQGSSYFTLLKGDVETDCMNAMRYDVACLGNHEFDNGLDELARRVRRCDFPVVCANYDFSHPGLGKAVKPYCILRRGGLKIGVIGVLTDLTVVVDREIADKIRYLDPAETVARYAAFLKDQDVVRVAYGFQPVGNDKQCLASKERVEAFLNAELVFRIQGGRSFIEDND